MFNVRPSYHTFASIAYPMLLRPKRYLSTVLIAVSPEDLGLRTLCPSRTGKVKRRMAIDLSI